MATKPKAEQGIAPALAERLWERFGRLSLDAVPEKVQRVATHCMMDWLGCASAGSREPLTGILRDEFAVVAGPASLIGSSLKVAPSTAALINGAAGHALDYDDTGGIGHPSAPMLPAALAVAEEQGMSGCDLLTAFIAGFEVECRIATIFGSEPYLNGYHSTSTWGVFGAAAAVAHLLGLDKEQFGCALGLAASQSSGVKANFGTMTKPFHAGHAAERGCVSARLAARGYTANPQAVEANQGLLQAMRVGDEFLHRLDEVEDTWFVPNTRFKYHAACYLTHSSINNVLEALQQIAREDVASVTLSVNPTILDVCGLYERPQTGLEAKFSLTGTAAMALTGVDTSAPDVFVAEVVQQAELQAAMEKVRIKTDDEFTVTQARATVTGQAGESITTESDTGIPASDLDAQEAALLGKFHALTDPLLGEDSKRVADRILNLPEQPAVSDFFLLKETAL